MAGKQKFTKEQVITALRSNRGRVYMTARELKCTPQTIQNYASRFSEVRQTIDNARELISDFAESKLYEQMETGNMAAIIWWLKTQAVLRGYRDRPEYVTDKDIEYQIKRIIDVVSRHVKDKETRLAIAEDLKPARQDVA